ncbi:MAG: hypothetical protein LBD92_06945 [Oscillospiraceae bacterium]|jgi:hypothetical protein|nr:hypothetical protein [Oscillospiraceae bacterium]
MVAIMAFAISIIAFFIGAAFLALAGLTFRFRAVANKAAWKGMTLPLLAAGLCILLPSLILIFLLYPR